MNRDTIDFGIDLGTTNSVISVAGEGEFEVIKNGNDPITPSVVNIDKRGVVKVGKSAAGALTQPKNAEDVQAEFKRRMGETCRLEFKAAGKHMTPTELSACVLRELRDAAKDRFGTLPSAAVITVPAMFEMPQRDATAKAAAMAGFEHSILLQEPVAAAIASGFQADVDKVYWLVYDYGGGTFDASIIAVRDGQLTVVKHAGDNYLGGADFDRVIVDEFIVPHLRSEYDLPRLDRLNVASDGKTLGRFNLLKVLAEEIKKELGRDETVEFYREEIFEDDAGDPVDLEITITRGDFEAAISKFVEKSINITKELISDSELTAGDIERVLLVGGSTFVPLVQRGVESLGIEIDRSQDPMTVVSKGAAIFASSQRLPKEQRAAAPVETGSARIELEYEPVGKDLVPPVAGKIRLEGVATTDGLTLEIARSDGGWTSGRLPVAANGLFMADVHLREKGQSSFDFKLRDAADESIACSPGSFSITYGMSVGKATLPSGLQIALADGTVHMLLPAGVSLPATSETREVKTVKALAKGSADSLRIPILSGDEPEAELNLVGNTFVLEGTSLSRDLPQGSTVEVTAAVDASGTSIISFTIPLLDETFEVTKDTVNIHEPSDAMWDRLRGIRVRLEELEEKGESAGQPAAVREVRAYRDSDALSEIERLIRLWESGDAVAAGQARNNLVEAAKKVKWLAGRVEWPAMVAEAEETKSEVKRLVHDHGDAEERQVLDQIIAEVDRAIAAEDPKMLERGTTALRTLRFAMVQKDPSFWVGFLQHLNGQKSRMTNQARADQLFNEGVMAMQRDDVESLKSVVRELLGLLPAEVAQQVQSGISSGVM